MAKRVPAVPRLYPVLVECVEEGAATGVRRAFKYAAHPTPEVIIEHVEREVLNLLCERLVIED